MMGKAVADIAKRYALTHQEIIQLTKTAMAARGRMDTLKRYGVYEFDGKTKLSNLGRSVEREVFYEFFKNDEEVFAIEYGPYDDSSEFLVVIDHRKKIPVGALRLIHFSDKGLKTLQDIIAKDSPWKLTFDDIRQHHDIRSENTWDIATLAIKKGYRGKNSRRFIRGLLFHGLYTHAQDHHIVHWVALLDDYHLRSFSELGVEFKSIANSESKPYLGSPSTRPIILYIPKIAQDVKNKSRLNHNLLIKGRILRTFASFPR